MYNGPVVGANGLADSFVTAEIDLELEFVRNAD